MANITFKGNEIQTAGTLPRVGDKAPAFTLTTASLKDVGLDEYKGKKKILTINPSLDTGVCQATARAFNEKAGSRDDAVVLVISADLPFAQKRFCEADGITGVHTLSMMRDRSFGKTYGLEMASGPLKGLLARAVLVLDADDIVRHVELVPEVVHEPNYDAALAAL